jgi:RNA polymerase sigma-70 factor (ECF subfamily)
MDILAEIPAPNAPESELLDLVMDLPRNYRVSIYLNYYEGYQVKEIAAMYGKSENAISTYLRRGRQKLRQMLDRQ